MKVHHRSIPNDTLSCEKGEYSIRVSTHREQIVISVSKNGKLVHNQWMDFADFVSLLMRDANDR